MKLSTITALVFSLAFGASADVFPASTNANNTFFGTNTFLAPVTASGYSVATNSWALNTPIPFGTNGLLLVSGAVTGGITGVANFPTASEGCVQLTVVATGNVVFTNPVSIHASDGLTSRTIASGVRTVFAVDVIPGVRTNMALSNFP